VEKEGMSLPYLCDWVTTFVLRPFLKRLPHTFV
jgi:hypothetical protein